MHGTFSLFSCHGESSDCIHYYPSSSNCVWNLQLVSWSFKRSKYSLDVTHINIFYAPWLPLWSLRTKPIPITQQLNQIKVPFFLIPIDGVAARSCTWSLSMSIARTPSMKSGRVEVLMPSRNSVFITPSICPITHAFTLLILGIR